MGWGHDDNRQSRLAVPGYHVGKCRAEGLHSHATRGDITWTSPWCKDLVRALQKSLWQPVDDSDIVASSADRVSLN